HEADKKLSYDNLEHARLAANKKSGYDSEQSRTDLRRLFHQQFHYDPYDWQVDILETFYLGLDCTLIAGTGSGKTMPFVMPLLLQDRRKMVVIISPLKNLEQDQ
ncbi:hypothetical protein JAAARDRAFT_112333, partial [Jaapia argillacea MUCL 33604]